MLKQIKDSTILPKTSIKTLSRNSIILPSFVGVTLQVYNGKTFTVLKVIDEMIDHKIGEFIPTRKQFSYKKKKKK